MSLDFDIHRGSGISPLSILEDDCSLFFITHSTFSLYFMREALTFYNSIMLKEVPGDPHAG